MEEGNERGRMARKEGMVWRLRNDSTKGGRGKKGKKEGIKGGMKIGRKERAKEGRNEWGER